MSTLPKLIEAAQPLLLAWGLEEAMVDDTGFRDNGVAIFENRDVRVRIESEQGSPGIDVASQAEPENWIDASLLLNLLNRKSLIDYNEFVDVVAFAVANQPVLIDALTHGYPAFRARVVEAKRARHRLQFPGVEIG